MPPLLLRVPSGRWSVRAATRGDVDSIYRVQCAVYPAALWESRAVLESIVRAGAGTGLCKVAESPTFGTCGYVLAHPWHSLTRPPALNVSIDENADASVCVFVHDMAVSSEVRGQGVGSALLDTLRSPVLMLVAIDDMAREFWSRRGFVACAHQDFLESYSTDTTTPVLMQKKVGGKEDDDDA